MKFIKNIITKTIQEFLNENHIDDELFDIMYNYRHNFTNSVIMSYHGRIKNGYIAKFYLKEFLKFYNVDDLKKNKKLGRFC